METIDEDDALTRSFKLVTRSRPPRLLPPLSEIQSWTASSDPLNLPAYLGSHPPRLLPPLSEIQSWTASSDPLNLPAYLGSHPGHALLPLPELACLRSYLGHDLLAARGLRLAFPLLTLLVLATHYSV